MTTKKQAVPKVKQITPDMIKSKLDLLAEFHSQVEIQNLAKREALDAAIPDEIKDLMKAIEEEYDQQMSGAKNNIDNLRAEIKALTADLLAQAGPDAGDLIGTTIKGDMMSVQIKGATPKWDDKKLVAYAQVNNPLIFSWRKTGDPVIAITINRS